MAIILGKEPVTLRVVVDVDAGKLMGISLFQLRLLSRACAQFAAATPSQRRGVLPIVVFVVWFKPARPRRFHAHTYAVVVEPGGLTATFYDPIQRGKQAPLAERVRAQFVAQLSNHLRTKCGGIRLRYSTALCPQAASDKHLCLPFVLLYCHAKAHGLGDHQMQAVFDGCVNASGQHASARALGERYSNAIARLPACAALPRASEERFLQEDTQARKPDSHCEFYFRRARSEAQAARQLQWLTARVRGEATPDLFKVAPSIYSGQDGFRQSKQISANPPI